MYEALVKRLRNCATQPAPCNTCDLAEDGSCSDTQMKQAADAIDELSAINQRQMLEIAVLGKERKTGTWINYLEDGFVECPFCKSATNCDGNIAELHYCFNCGAKLEGDDD